MILNAALDMDCVQFFYTSRKELGRAESVKHVELDRGYNVKLPATCGGLKLSAIPEKVDSFVREVSQQWSELRQEYRAL